MCVLPELYSAATTALLLGLHVEKRACVIGRHDLDEVRQRLVPVVEQLARARAAGVEQVPLDQDAQPFGVEASMSPMPLFSTEGARCSGASASGPPSAGFTGSSFTIDGLQRLAKRLVGIVDVGHAARHAGRKVAPGLAQHDDHAAGHVFAAMVAAAFDDRDSARVAHGEALARDAFEIGLARNGAVEDRVADDDVLASARA